LVHRDAITLDAAARQEARARLRGLRWTQLDDRYVELHRWRQWNGGRHAGWIGCRLDVHAVDDEDLRRRSALLKLETELPLDHGEHGNAIGAGALQRRERRERHVEIPVARQPCLVLHRTGDVAAG